MKKQTVYFGQNNTQINQIPVTLISKETISQIASWNNGNVDIQFLDMQNVQKIENNNVGQNLVCLIMDTKAYRLDVKTIQKIQTDHGSNIDIVVVDTAELQNNDNLIVQLGQQSKTVYLTKQTENTDVAFWQQNAIDKANTKNVTYQFIELNVINAEKEPVGAGCGECNNRTCQ